MNEGDVGGDGWGEENIARGCRRGFSSLKYRSLEDSFPRARCPRSERTLTLPLSSPSYPACDGLPDPTQP